MPYAKRLECELSTWPGISIHSHRFGGREFQFGSAEVGHVHTVGVEGSVALTIHSDFLKEIAKWKT
jgi:hypothetical protein